MKQESKQKKNVGTSVMGNDIETTQNTMHVLDENKVLKKSYEDVVYISQPFGATSLNTLAARALLFGLNPVSLKKARVLDVLLAGTLFLKLYTILKRLLRVLIYRLPRLRWEMN